ncbi:MAG: tRNA (adenosine(37)-N6)-dimethylallyltransferase MiaA [Bacteroidales bacterium]|nr:tRNA (adenosine(37)-N6)-dimethylallyltransferase MiaA [Bacteroidales bacterium]MDD4739083.1 tRNA (adenosine(37)-N6)-dimethylallyltransferase MiaA [Bacteroidales bacterium]
MNNKKLIVLTGPTAVGKTKEAINLAKALNTEIISADSRQFYKELNIGVATPSKEELEEVKHHFIGHISIHNNYNVGLFEKDALERIDLLFKTYDTIVLTGGSGMYIDVVCNGMDSLPDVDIEIRNELNRIFKEEGISVLQEELKEKDIEYHNIVDTKNHIRLIRALEVIRQTGKTFSFYRTNQKTQRDFQIVKFALQRERSELIERIDKRVDLMIESGLLEEAKEVYPYKNLSALNTVGYKELFKYFDNQISFQQAIEDVKTNTRRYAKRQMTWFRKDKEYIWLDAKNPINWKEVLDGKI